MIIILKKSEARSDTKVVQGGFGGSAGASADWPGTPGVLALEAPTQHWPLPTLAPLMGSDKVAAHADE